MPQSVTKSGATDIRSTYDTAGRRTMVVSGGVTTSYLSRLGWLNPRWLERSVGLDGLRWAILLANDRHFFARHFPFYQREARIKIATGSPKPA